MDQVQKNSIMSDEKKYVYLKRLEVFAAVHIHCRVCWTSLCVAVVKITDVSGELASFFSADPSRIAIGQYCQIG
jgi:hypothetical protein